MSGANTLRAHYRYVAAVKGAAERSLGSVGKLPPPSDASPYIVGGQPLRFVPPMAMDRALGYRGSLRYVEFSFSPRTLKFGCSDGGATTPGDENLWAKFLRHPLVRDELPRSRYPTLHGRFPVDLLKQFRAARSLPGAFPCAGRWHCLILDRRLCEAFLCTRAQALLFFPLTEPVERDSHTVFRNGLLLDRRTKTRPREDQLALARKMIAELDEEFELLTSGEELPMP